IGLQRCQQMLADLNRYAVRPSRSIGVLYDHREEAAQLARLVVLRSPVFRDVVEMELSTLSARSRTLVTLSAIYSATSVLVAGLDGAQTFDPSGTAPVCAALRRSRTPLAGAALRKPPVDS